MRPIAEKGKAFARTNCRCFALEAVVPTPWMLEGIISALPPDDPRKFHLETVAEAHRRAGLAAVTGKHYEGGHWLGSFAVYLTTKRGITSTKAK